MPLNTLTPLPHSYPTAHVQLLQTPFLNGTRGDAVFLKSSDRSLCCFCRSGAAAAALVMLLSALLILLLRC